MHFLIQEHMKMAQDELLFAYYYLVLQHLGKIFFKELVTHLGSNIKLLTIFQDQND